MTGIGASAQSITSFRSHLGEPMQWFRFYITAEQTWGSSTLNPVRTADGLGERCVISFKTSGTWSQVASGAKDSVLTDWANGAASLANDGILVFFHEPEDDTATMGTSAQFRSATQHVISVMRPIVGTGWKFYNCYSDYTFSTLSGRNADDWYVPELDGIGFDFYNWATANNGGPWATVNPSTVDPRVIFRNENGHQPAFPKDDVRNYAASKGKPYFLMEFGCAIRSPGGPTQEAERTAWFTSFADYLRDNSDPNFIGATYFNFNAGESGAVYNWAMDRDSGIGLAPATMAQFARINNAAYHWSIVSGSLPAGLSLSTDGIISGTPTLAETRNPTFRVTDSLAATSQRQIQISVVDVSPIITTPDLSPGELTLAYNDSVGASGGTGPYVFSVAVGPLPPGVSMSSAGAFTGTPTTVGTYPFRLRVTDAALHTGLRDYSVTIYPELVFAQPDLPEGVLFQPYSEVVTATGGATPLFFVVHSSDPGRLPGGLDLSDDGILSGFPTEAGSFQFIITCVDQLDVEQEAICTLEIAVPETVAEVNRTPGRGFSQRRPTGGSRMRDEAMT